MEEHQRMRETIHDANTGAVGWLRTLSRRHFPEDRNVSEAIGAAKKVGYENGIMIKDSEVSRIFSIVKLGGAAEDRVWGETKHRCVCGV
jgi:hypothetical protein